MHKVEGKRRGEIKEKKTRSRGRRREGIRSKGIPIRKGDRGGAKEGGRERKEMWEESELIDLVKQRDGGEERQEEEGGKKEGEEECRRGDIGIGGGGRVEGEEECRRGELGRGKGGGGMEKKNGQRR